MYPRYFNRNVTILGRQKLQGPTLALKQKDKNVSQQTTKTTPCGMSHWKHNSDSLKLSHIWKQEVFPLSYIAKRDEPKLLNIKYLNIKNICSCKSSMVNYIKAI